VGSGAPDDCKSSAISEVKSSMAYSFGHLRWWPEFAAASASAAGARLP
jgi:hypothetical protein